MGKLRASARTAADVYRMTALHEDRDCPGGSGLYIDEQTRAEAASRSWRRWDPSGSKQPSER